LLDAVLAPFPDTDAPLDEELGPKVAVIGRPNVGKSTLINRLLGSNRLITSPVARHHALTASSCRASATAASSCLIDTAGYSPPRTRERGDREVQHRTEPAGNRGRGAVIALLDARDGVSDQTCTSSASPPRAGARS
jgi:GTP-binding protein